MIEIGRVYHDVDNPNRSVVVEAVSRGNVYTVFADEHPSGTGIVVLGVRPDPMPVERFTDQWA